MSLPPGFLDELRERVSLAQVVGRKVSWDRRKSNPGKGDWWAPCPFHEERTPSFHVDDRKGFYYCFGCHAKGDAITFVQETENVSFIEAVEILAREAGMAMPARDPAAAAREAAVRGLHEAMEAAQNFYRMQLSTTRGAEARAWIEARGLRAETVERFGLGFAPDARDALLRHLRERGFADEIIVGAGLAARPEDGAPYDRFRHRVTFPIRDARGRVIAFGGRALSDAQRAKYLNSPETPLFDKGRVLYNLAPAREAAGKGQPLIVAEGYMDVIALVQAGFEAAVAPLGTAITEQQLAMLWRIAPEPVVALDGDTAGLRAAMRLVDLALPGLAPGRTLRFAILPEGRDPDDVIRTEGRAGIARLLERAEPLVRMLWLRETEGLSFDTPEARAALDARLRELLSRIRDPDVRRHYGAEFRRLRDALFRPAAPGGGRRAARGAEAAGPGRFRRGGPGKRLAPPTAPLPQTRNSLLATAARGAQPVEEHLREAVILASLVLHPALIPEFEAELETLECTIPEHALLRDALLEVSAGTAGEMRATLVERLGPGPLEKVLSPSHVRISPSVRHAGDEEIARRAIRAELDRLAAERGLKREIEDAVEDLDRLGQEAVGWRIAEAARSWREARHRGSRLEDEDGDLEERRSWLDSFLQTRPWERRRGRR